MSADIPRQHNRCQRISPGRKNRFWVGVFVGLALGRGPDHAPRLSFCVSRVSRVSRGAPLRAAVRRRPSRIAGKTVLARSKRKEREFARKDSRALRSFAGPRQTGASMSNHEQRRACPEHRLARAQARARSGSAKRFSFSPFSPFSSFSSFSSFSAVASRASARGDAIFTRVVRSSSSARPAGERLRETGVVGALRPTEAVTRTESRRASRFSGERRAEGAARSREGPRGR